MDTFISVEELERKIRDKSYSVKRGKDGEWDFGMSNEDIFENIENCKQYGIKEFCTAEWEKVANNIEMEQVTRVGLRLKCSKCGNVVFATRVNSGYVIDNYCSHCGARMLEKVGEGDV